ncbi:DNA polymerase beta superfamily protein [Frondihabitans sp. PAMC 28766]|uniref:DNA polymerase beta superfamily protein n=1 Tax=Frondihabitans sp. PAMC 28766 TaxID=1795630 RepID=UPI002100C2B5|nr:nucleotidyltransferase domain-containing protein [Frondihabitans sp. PAMC 28766]
MAHVGRADQAQGVFYALRAATALRWLEVNPTSGVVPMQLSTLLAESDPPPALLTETADLLELKRATRELGVGTPPPAILKFVDAQFERAMTLYERAESRSAADKQKAADAFFRDVIERSGRR